MKLICDACAHVYDTDPSHDGRLDPVCSKSPKGSLRQPTRAELVLLRRYAELHKDFERQARLIREAHVCA